MNKITIKNSRKIEKKRKLDYVHIYITRKCNLHCLHCYTESDSGITDILPVLFWKDVIKQLEDMEVKCVHIEGGEALYYPGIEEIIGFLAQTKIKEVLIVTNGILATREKLVALKNAGLKKIAISLDSFDEDIHNLLRPQSHKFAIKAINNAVDLGFYTRISTVLTRKNVSNISNFIDEVYNCGVRTLNIDWFNSAGRGAGLFNEYSITEKDDDLLDIFEKKIFEVIINSKYKNFNISIDLPEWYESRDSFIVKDSKRTHYLGCDAIKGQISINEIGNVYPCFIYSNGPNFLGNMQDSTLKDILVNADFKRTDCPIKVKKHLFYQIKV